ncbi:hypothetical protein Goarm_006543 [Gossypium armourianum]|uniref:SPX domain-containing protein n=1 Tax=Gossypium armourianum TaxID=34283 RepID=A0A7J9JIT4_9ROSI|nr:hypothetical protein [Gossypium armourianum]
MAKIRKDVVDFHGEMVLLENYSNINFTGTFTFNTKTIRSQIVNHFHLINNGWEFVGLAKILKKYDKRTGRLLRLPFIQKVLKQPFFTTDLVSNLVKECENTIDEVLFPIEEDKEETKEQKGAIMVATEPVKGIFRNTVAALLTMEEIRRVSSTKDHFSLPPLNLSHSHLIHSFQLNSPIPIL